MILDLNSQHASPELCRRLWELGVDTGTAMTWSRRTATYASGEVSREEWRLGRYGLVHEIGVRDLPFGGDGVAVVETIPAYSVAELGELLRACKGSAPSDYMDGSGWFFFQGGEVQEHPTEANARAALLIHILESENENAR